MLSEASTKWPLGHFLCLHISSISKASVGCMSGSHGSPKFCLVAGFLESASLLSGKAAVSAICFSAASLLHPPWVIHRTHPGNQKNSEPAVSKERIKLLQATWKEKGPWKLRPNNIISNRSLRSSKGTRWKGPD